MLGSWDSSRLAAIAVKFCFWFCNIILSVLMLFNLF